MIRDLTGNDLEKVSGGFDGASGGSSGADDIGPHVNCFVDMGEPTKLSRSLLDHGAGSGTDGDYGDGDVPSNSRGSFSFPFFGLQQPLSFQASQFQTRGAAVQRPANASVKHDTIRALSRTQAPITWKTPYLNR